MKRFVLLVALAGCSSSDSTQPPPAATSAAPSATVERSSAEKPARALFDRWLAAQNEGDFAAYQGLYAAKFEGVKRAGPRMRRFARDGWLADRKPMFEKTMKVDASDVTVLASAESARVRFVQRFTSGTFQDEGPKEIVVVKDGDGWKIAREEMLRSSLSKVGAAAIGGEQFAFVVHQNGTRVVIAANPDGTWMRGAPRLLSDASPVVTEAGVDEAKLPEALSAWRGRSLRLFAKGGEACQAVVTGFSLLARVEPHFGTRAMWRGKPEEAGIVLDGPSTPLSRAEIADSAYGMGGQLLVANIKPQSGSCGAALWARGAALPVPKAAAAEAPPEALARRAMEAFRKLPAYRAIADDYSKQGGAAAHWEEHEGAMPEVRQFRIDAKVTMLAVRAEAGVGCGDFAGRLFALFELSGDRLTPANEPADGAMPESAADVDGDGKVELIGDETIRRAKGTSWDQVDELTVPFLDCGC